MLAIADRTREYDRQVHRGTQLLKEPALTETSAGPSVTGFHHFSPTVSDVEGTGE